MVIQMNQQSKSNRGKKAAATALIALFSISLLTSNSRMANLPNGDVAGALGQLTGVLFLIAFLILSIRWRLRLSGYLKTAGRQAVAIFLIAFCALGLLLVPMAVIVFAKTPALLTIPVIFAALYIGGLYACIRWVRRLRGTERQEASGAIT